MELQKYYTFLDDYLHARNKAKIAEYNSDLNSDSDLKLRKIRKKKHVIQSSSETEDEDTRNCISIADPPKFIKNSSNNIHKKVMDSLTTSNSQQNVFDESPSPSMSEENPCQTGKVHIFSKRKLTNY